MNRRFACTLLLSFSLVSLGHAVDRTVSKPGGGGTYLTIMAAVTAANPSDTITILDSGVYVEDLLINKNFLTIQAAAGVRPTVQAANLVNRYPGLGITSASDHAGVAVVAPCTFIGLIITNPDPTTSQQGADDFAAMSMMINSPLVILRDCWILGPTAGLAGGDWANLLVIALSPTPAGLTAENCIIQGGEYGAVCETFANYLPGLPTSTLVLRDCLVSSTTQSGIQVDAGETTAVHCLIRDNQGMGVGGGGGKINLVSCDISYNGDMGLELDWNSSFAAAGDYCRVTANDCLFRSNGSGEHQIHIRDGSLTIRRSILLQGDSGGVYLHNDDPGPASINMDFCDIYDPTKPCIEFEATGGFASTGTITNSILVGTDGVIGGDATHKATISYSDVQASGVRFSANMTESNNVNITPLYMLPYGGQRDGFRYTNTNLNVGQGGQQIGSQGRYIPPQPLRARGWHLYN
jgi:hypothetical protein